MINDQHPLLKEAVALTDKATPETLDRAYKIASHLFRSEPENPYIANVIARCHMKAGRHETAYYALRYIQKFKEFDGPYLWLNIGHCLAERERWAEASTFFNRALQKEPNNPVANANLASIFCKSGDPIRAVEFAEKALAVSPDSQEAKWNGALAHLKLKHWPKGWDWYDELLGSKLRPLPPKINGEELPRWDGTHGELLVQGEQGLGDEIMFSSMLPDVMKSTNATVLCDPRLIGLFSRSFGVTATSRKSKDIVIPKPINFTHAVNLGSLGRYFRQKNGDFPGKPYLKACPVRSQMYQGLLESLGDKPKIGIMWRGGVGGLDERERTLELHELEPLLSEDFEWVSLNHLPSAKSECERFYETTGIRIHHWDFVHSQDYDDTAALVSQLDHVVSITCTAAHLAGALGIRTHVLVPKMPQWRYGYEGDSIPWYRSMKLYRQTDAGWPLASVSAALG